MFVKIYDFLKKILKRNYKSIIFLICFVVIMTYPVPYYIFTSGGILDLSNRFEIEDSYEQSGSYNLSYVSEIEGNVLTYLASMVIPSWELVDVSNYQASDDETLEDLAIRDRLSLEQANQFAVFLAYEKAGFPLKINSTNLYIAYTADYLESTKKIKVGDLITKIDGQSIQDFSSIDEKNVGDTITIELSRNGSSFETEVQIKEIDGKKAIGISLYRIYDYEVSPSIKFNFLYNESGSSAGLMTSLAIYDALIKEDLTNGLKIAGTGSLGSDGSVLEIGGVKYKLKGAVFANADVFFVPAGDNYEECLKLKEEKNYDIELVSIATFDQAVEYLKNL